MARLVGARRNPSELSGVCAVLPARYIDSRKEEEELSRAAQHQHPSSSGWGGLSQLVVVVRSKFQSVMQERGRGAFQNVCMPCHPYPSETSVHNFSNKKEEYVAGAACCSILLGSIPSFFCVLQSCKGGGGIDDDELRS